MQPDIWQDADGNEYQSCDANASGGDFDYFVPANPFTPSGEFYPFNLSIIGGVIRWLKPKNPLPPKLPMPPKLRLPKPSAGTSGT